MRVGRWETMNGRTMDKNRETRSIKGKLDETRKVSLDFPFFPVDSRRIPLRERERKREEEGDRKRRRVAKGEVGSEIGRESWRGRGGRGASGSAEERIEIFGEEMETFPNGSCLYERPFPVVRLDEIARKTTF